MIARMWTLSLALRESGVPTRLFKSKEIGTVIYKDHYQLVAKPRNKARLRF